MRAIQVEEYGGRDALSLVETDVPEPGDGEVRIEVNAAGINFADIMQRRGHYQGGPEAPYVPGLEVADAPADAVTHGVDDARDFQPRNVGGLRTTLVVTPALHDVREVDPRGLHLDAHFAVVGFRDVRPDEREGVASAVLLDLDCSHRS